MAGDLIQHRGEVVAVAVHLVDDASSDPAALMDAVKAVGFFPGPRAVHVEAATDGLAPVIAAALADDSHTKLDEALGAEPAIPNLRSA